MQLGSRKTVKDQEYQKRKDAIKKLHRRAKEEPEGRLLEALHQQLSISSSSFPSTSTGTESTPHVFPRSRRAYTNMQTMRSGNYVWEAKPQRREPDRFIESMALRPGKAERERRKAESLELRSSGVRKRAGLAISEMSEKPEWELRGLPPPQMALPATRYSKGMSASLFYETEPEKATYSSSSSSSLSSPSALPKTYPQRLEEEEEEKNKRDKCFGCRFFFYEPDSDVLLFLRPIGVRLDDQEVLFANNKVHAVLQLFPSVKKKSTLKIPEDLQDTFGTEELQEQEEEEENGEEEDTGEDANPFHARISYIYRKIVDVIDEVSTSISKMIPTGDQLLLDPEGEKLDELEEWVAKAWNSDTRMVTRSIFFKESSVIQVWFDNFYVLYISYGPLGAEEVKNYDPSKRIGLPVFMTEKQFDEQEFEHKKYQNTKKIQSQIEQMSQSEREENSITEALQIEAARPKEHSELRGRNNNKKRSIHAEEKNELDIQMFYYGDRLVGDFDTLDKIICGEAPRKGYGSVILSREPGSHQGNTEIIAIGTDEEITNRVVPIVDRLPTAADARRAKDKSEEEFEKKSESSSSSTTATTVTNAAGPRGKKTITELRLDNRKVFQQQLTVQDLLDAIYKTVKETYDLKELELMFAFKLNFPHQLERGFHLLLDGVNQAPADSIEDSKRNFLTFMANRSKYVLGELNRKVSRYLEREGDGNDKYNTDHVFQIYPYIELAATVAELVQKEYSTYKTPRQRKPAEFTALVIAEWKRKCRDISYLRPRMMTEGELPGLYP